MDDELYAKIVTHQGKINKLEELKYTISHCYGNVQFIIKSKSSWWEFTEKSKTKLDVDPNTMTSILDELIKQERIKIDYIIDELIEQKSEEKLLEEYKNGKNL